jgi:hypothetical protein
MNTRLKIICILFAAAYFFTIGEYVIRDAAPSFTAGFKEGSEMEITAAYQEGYKFGKNLHDFLHPQQQATPKADSKSEQNLPVKDTTEVKTSSNYEEFCFLFVQPKQGLFSFPSSLQNLTIGKPIQSEITKLYVRVEVQSLPLWLTIARIIMYILYLGILFCLIYVPVQAYRVIRSIVKSDIFDMKNIKRIRRIGYVLLITFVLALYVNIVNTAVAQQWISLDDYKIVFSMAEDYPFLLFGLMVLLFAEVLKISHTLKEEQEFTI